MSAGLKEVMASFATGVTVVTASHRGQDLGMTCNSFNTVSLNPALVLWSIRKESASHAAFLESGGFVINVLGRHQKELALRFTRGSHEERFDGVEQVRTGSGRLRIGGSLAWMDCQLEQVVPAGDHDILIGRVLTFGRQEGEGLVYLRRAFGVLQPLAA